MPSIQKNFGKKKFRAYHGSIPLNARRRVHCTITRRVNRTIYIEVAEPIQIPFFFKIELDYDKGWIDCEAKSQNGRFIAAQMVAASFDSFAPEIGRPQISTSIASVEELMAWCGRARTD